MPAATATKKRWSAISASTTSMICKPAGNATHSRSNLSPQLDRPLNHAHPRAHFGGHAVVQPRPPLHVSITTNIPFTHGGRLSCRWMIPLHPPTHRWNQVTSLESLHHFEEHHVC